MGRQSPLLRLLRRFVAIPRFVFTTTTLFMMMMIMFRRRSLSTRMIVSERVLLQSKTAIFVHTYSYQQLPKLRRPRRDLDAPRRRSNHHVPSFGSFTPTLSPMYAMDRKNEEHHGTSSSLSMSSTTDDSYNYDPYDDYDPTAAALNVQYDMESDFSIDESLAQLPLDIYDDLPLTSSSSEIEEIYANDDSYDTEGTSSGPVVIDDQSPILRGLNDNQADAVTKPIRCITRVIAGPGSGKTRVLTNRIAYLLQQNSRDKILGLTFSRKAANEMQERLHKLIEEQERLFPSKRRSYIDEEFIGTNGNDANTEGALRRVTLGTFHSVCSKILRWNGDYLASLPAILNDMSKSPTSNTNIVLNGMFHISDPRENLRTLREILEEYQINLNNEKNVKLDDIMKVIDSIKVQLFAGENPFDKLSGVDTASRKVVIARQVYYRYREKFLSSNCLDFDDLLYLTRELLTHRPEVRTRLQSRWDHIVVDEYQDTSIVQIDLIKLLTTDSLFVVGDADQSIYAWRGAYAESLFDFAKEFHEFSRDGVFTVYLMENYRSTSKIVEAAQKVIASSKDKSGADKLRREMIPRGSDGTSPRIISFRNGEAEADYLVKHIRSQLSSGEYSAKHTVAFIYRTNAQSRLIEESCVRFNLPYVIYGSFTSFYNRQEIKDCLCFLRWMHNGYDRVAMLRAIETPKRGLGDTAIREFDDYCEAVGKCWDEFHPGETKPNALNVLFQLSGDYSWCTIPNPQFPPPGEIISSRPLKLFREFSKAMVQLSRLGTERTVSQALLDVLDMFHLRPHFDKISKTKDEYEERLQNVDELMKAANRYENDGACMVLKNKGIASELDDEIQSPLGQFLDDISLVTDLASSSAANAGEERFVACLMSIHASKGLEFDTVFFVGVEDGTIPSSQSIYKGEGSIPYEEEKRLCYVAMTRAKSELFITWRQSAPAFTSEGINFVDKSRSRFLDPLVSKKPQDSLTRSPNPTTPNKNENWKEKYRSVKPAYEKRASQIKAWGDPIPKKKQLGTSSEAKFTGTASVYASNTKKVTDKKSTTLKGEKLSARVVSPKQPLAPMETRGSVPFAAKEAAPSAQSQRAANRSIHMQATSPTIGSTGGVSNEAQRSLPSIDSSWFFPIGSKVRHKIHGEGVVMTPQSTTRNGSMSVLVEFNNGEKQEFPVQTTELSPIVVK